MGETETKAEAAPIRACRLEAGADGVRILVDGAVAQVMPFDAYESLRKGLAASEQLNLFPLEIPGQAGLKLQLPPLTEVKTARVALESRDGVTYGRGYKVVSVKREADGLTRATLAAADTGEVVERAAWDEFKARVKAGECRSATPYAAMLGEFNARLYFTVTGVIYQPSEGGPKSERGAGAPGVEGVAPQTAAETAPPKSIMRAFWTWAAKNPRVACTGVVLLGLLVGFGIRLIVQSARAKIPTVVVSNPRSVEYFLEKNWEIAKSLDADFEAYARKQPKAARDNVEKLKDFLDKTREVGLSSSEQVAKLKFIREAVPRLEAQLAKAKPR